MRVPYRIVAATLATAAALSVSTPSPSASGDTSFQYLPEDLASSFVPASSALQCSLLDTSTHNEAGILGQDGGTSYAHNGSAYWTFSDTNLDAPPYQLPNTVATSSAAEALNTPEAGATASDTPCLSLTYPKSAGVPAVMLPPPSAGCVDWPTQFVAPSAESSTLYFIYSRQSQADASAPCELLSGAGIGALDTGSLTASRLDSQLTWQDLPGQPVQVVGGTPLLADDGDGEYIYMFLIAGGDPDILGSTTAVALARVSPDDFADPEQYRYWSGDSWVRWDQFTSISIEDNVHFLWRQPNFGIQAGLKVSYLSHLGKWVAVYATNLASEIRIRTADHLTGPWSQESRIIDCVAQLANLPPRQSSSADADFPCYSAMIHDEFTSPDGLIVYFSFARNNWADGAGDYRVYMRRFNLASPVVEWTDEDGHRTLVAGSGVGSGTRQGLAFFESEVPLSGYIPVYAFDSTPPLPPDRIYALSSSPPPGYTESGIAFYAPQAGFRADIDTITVLIHQVLLASGQHAYTEGAVPEGAIDQGVAFRALVPNPDDDGDGTPDTEDDCPFNPSPDQSDTDHDGAGDICDQDDDNDNVPDLKLVAAPFPFAPLDNCRTVANPDQTDSDADFLGDACEATVYDTDPANPDSDGDGCRDGQEILLALDPTDGWDFYDVPVPYSAYQTNRGKNSAINGQDFLAVRSGTGHVVGDGVYNEQYDRTSESTQTNPFKAGPPDGVINAQDALVARDTIGLSCLGPGP